MKHRKLKDRTANKRGYWVSTTEGPRPRHTKKPAGNKLARAISRRIGV